MTAADNGLELTESATVPCNTAVQLIPVDHTKTDEVEIMMFTTR